MVLTRDHLVVVRGTFMSYVLICMPWLFCFKLPSLCFNYAIIFLLFSFHSGAVAGAKEALMCGIPAIAISLKWYFPPFNCYASFLHKQYHSVFNGSATGDIYNNLCVDLSAIMPFRLQLEDCRFSCCVVFFIKDIIMS